MISAGFGVKATASVVTLDKLYVCEAADDRFIGIYTKQTTKVEREYIFSNEQGMSIFRSFLMIISIYCMIYLNWFLLQTQLVLVHR
jgi:hypothetical protein